MRIAACIKRRNLATLHASAGCNENRIADRKNNQVNEGLNSVHGGAQARRSPTAPAADKALAQREGTWAIKIQGMYNFHAPKRSDGQYTKKLMITKGSHSFHRRLTLA